MGFYAAGRRERGFDGGIQLALERLLGADMEGAISVGKAGDDIQVGRQAGQDLGLAAARLRRDARGPAVLKAPIKVR